MQQTPFNPAMQLPHSLTFASQKVCNSQLAFIFGVAGQPFEQGSNRLNINSIICFGFTEHRKMDSYHIVKLNIHVLLINYVHCYFSLRYEHDFSVEAADKPLIEAKQFNFWKSHSSAPYNLNGNLDAQQKECI